MTDERFLALVYELTSNSDAVYETKKKGFGSGTLKVNNRIFALLSREQLVVKLPRKRADELVATGVGQHYNPGHGRLQKEWLSVESGDWETLAREALTFVRG
jgi:TfoX/Sxy family transcriptional regulator of competence genes